MNCVVARLDRGDVDGWVSVVDVGVDRQGFDEVAGPSGAAVVWRELATARRGHTGAGAGIVAGAPPAASSQWLQQN